MRNSPKHIIKCWEYKEVLSQGEEGQPFWGWLNCCAISFSRDSYTGVSGLQWEYLWSSAKTLSGPGWVRNHTHTHTNTKLCMHIHGRVPPSNKWMINRYMFTDMDLLSSQSSCSYQTNWGGCRFLWLVITEVTSASLKLTSVLHPKEKWFRNKSQTVTSGAELNRLKHFWQDLNLSVCTRLLSTLTELSQRIK